MKTILKHSTSFILAQCSEIPTPVHNKLMWFIKIANLHAGLYSLQCYWLNFLFQFFTDFLYSLWTSNSILKHRNCKKLPACVASSCRTVCTQPMMVYLPCPALKLQHTGILLLNSMMFIFDTVIHFSYWRKHLTDASSVICSAHVLFQSQLNEQPEYTQ